jgi:exodeoxyribonuclease VII large subunit
VQNTSPIRLSQLTHVIDETLSQVFEKARFWVIADVTNHSFRQEKNYHSFDLVEKDPDSNNIIAKVQSKAWGAGSASITEFQRTTGQRFTNNINVLVNVSVSFHAVYGLQLNVHEIDPNFTLGVLEQQRQATLRRLVEENPEFIRRAGELYVTKNKELELSRVVQRIAVISSQTSAGWQDFRHTLDNNPFGYVFHVDDYFTIVQGEHNARQFVSRLVEVFQSGKDYDAVVIIRGGGAQTDFLIFDDYLIGKAVAKFPIPVITGIGHQKNETIADMMAHTPLKTPTKAAEFIINHNRQFEDAVRGFQKTIIIKSQQQFSVAAQQLASWNGVIINASKTMLFERGRVILAIGSSLLTKPKSIVYNKLNDIKQVASHFGVSSAMYLKNKKGYLEHHVSLFRVLSPERTLKRGFALIKSNHKITGDPDDLRVGEDIQIILADQEIVSTVKSKTAYHGKDFNV